MSESYINHGVLVANHLKTADSVTTTFEPTFEPAFMPADGSTKVIPKKRYNYWPALNQAIGHVCNKCADIPHTPEEDAEFERIERNQEIALMANVIRSSPTTSAEGIATRMFDAGYRFDSSKVEV